MDTVLLNNKEKDLEIAAEFIKKGEIVGIPTETVYGLGRRYFRRKADLPIIRS